MVQSCLKECQVPQELRDDDWLRIQFEFHVNFTEESIRLGYQKAVKEADNKVDNDLLRKLGYSEKSIQRRRM